MSPQSQESAAAVVVDMVMSAKISTVVVIAIRVFKFNFVFIFLLSPPNFLKKDFVAPLRGADAPRTIMDDRGANIFCITSIEPLEADQSYPH
jgi:hypothetical protein